MIVSLQNFALFGLQKDGPLPMAHLLKKLIPLVEELWGAHPEKAIETIFLMRLEVAL